MSARFLIRGPDAEDVNYILATWNEGLYYGTEFFAKNCDRTKFFEGNNNLIKKILIRPSVEVKVCCLPDEEDCILGYSVSEGQTLHWVYVRKAWRKMGISKLLVPKTTKEVSFINDLGFSLMPKHWKINFFKLMELTNA